MMKVVSILGSPRKKGYGNSIARAFTDQAQSLGAEVSEFYLNSMDFVGCQACRACQVKGDPCVLKDDLTSALKAIHEADYVVLSTPVYCGDASAQFKRFFDRTYSFFTWSEADNYNLAQRLPRGKKTLFIVTQGDHLTAHLDVSIRYNLYLDMYGLKDRTLIRGLNLSMKADNNSADGYKKQAKQLAEKWISTIKIMELKA